MDESKALEFVVIVEVVALLGLLLMGALLVVALMSPHWLVGWWASLTAPEPKAFWYLSRVAGLIAYTLLCLAVILGLSVTNKLARVWPGGPAAVDLHQFASLLGLSFTAFHVLVLLGDHYIGYTLPQLLIPFASTDYRPLWVGLGQIALYLAVPIALSFYVRRWIGYRTWRSLHYGTFGVYALTTLHGLLAGTDAQNPLVLALYGGTALVVVGLTVHRLRLTALQTRRALS